jgi:hypothetical protein
MNTTTTENLDGLFDCMISWKKRSKCSCTFLNGSVQIDNKILSATIQTIPAYLDSILLEFCNKWYQV